MFYSISETALLSELRVLVFAVPSDDPKGKSGCAWVTLSCLLTDLGLREFCQKRHVKIGIDNRWAKCIEPRGYSHKPSKIAVDALA